MAEYELNIAEEITAIDIAETAVKADADTHQKYYKSLYEERDRVSQNFMRNTANAYDVIHEIKTNISIDDVYHRERMITDIKNALDYDERVVAWNIEQAILQNHSNRTDIVHPPFYHEWSIWRWIFGGWCEFIIRKIPAVLLNVLSVGTVQKRKKAQEETILNNIYEKWTASQKKAERKIAETEKTDDADKKTEEKAEQTDKQRKPSKPRKKASESEIIPEKQASMVPLSSEHLAEDNKMIKQQAALDAPQAASGSNTSGVITADELDEILKAVSND